jgi:propionate CoA-transferase
VERCLAPLAHKVPAIIDYDNFHVLPQVIDEYSDMVRELALKYYSRVTRYTTSAFLRVKLGEALRQRGVAPHIFESAEQARAHLLDADA